MRNIIAFLVALLVFVAPALSGATTQASKTRVTRGYSHAMCPTFGAGTGVCDNGAAGDDLYARVDMYSTVTFNYTEDGTGACDVYAATQNIDVPGTADLSGLTANKINSTSLSDALDKITFSNFDFYYMWVQCDTVATSVTVEMQGSIGLERLIR